ncbi:alkaline phosphatase family protein [Anthocerotibacter panamensis]|uniref:alkaline phosphatase family protein n=1 Tax=Anthocerotibacter panamensis TaxID=2857077 RepID=UPI001C407233|nr:nucleotide pyrophosphatase/phosphodiesterase family protein [Anthocerotibacter panamensis]
MDKTVVLNIVGLTPGLLGAHTPLLSRWAAQGRVVPVQPILPAVTCSVQASFLTGVTPAQHGIVGNGWYFREEGEVKFWRQSNRLVQAPKVWEIARAHDPTFTCANLFWWYNLYSSVDIAVTPRPMYPADGRKLPDLYTHPAELRTTLQTALGTFPLFQFWGPGASIRSSAWIAEASRIVEEQFHPTLTLVYLPHLDYPLQRFGPEDPRICPELRAIDQIAGDLIAFYESRGTRVLVLSEYGITPVIRPVHLNRVLREAKYLQVREELGRELLDAGASAAFAVADHQLAHIYVQDQAHVAQVRERVAGVPGVAEVLDGHGQARHHLHHPRAGDLVAVAAPDSWFTYYYWLDDRRAPDFARTVDIHRKPGYDPVELFLDPTLPLPQLQIAWTLLKKKLGLHSLLEVISLDSGLVRGSHGRLPEDPKAGPLVISRQTQLLTTPTLQATEIHRLILAHLGHQNLLP